MIRVKSVNSTLMVAYKDKRMLQFQIKILKYELLAKVMGLSAVKLMQVRMLKQSKPSHKIDGHCINVKSPAYILLTNEILKNLVFFFKFRNSLIKMNFIYVIISYF